jgi:FkbM family methyltransferase
MTSVPVPRGAPPRALIIKLKATQGRAAKLARLLPRREYRAGLRHGVAAAIEHDAARLQRPPRTILDVGANRGQFALFALRRFPRARLICFEPLAEPAAVLRRVVADHPGVEVHEVALSAISGVQSMHLTRKDDSSSLLPVTERQEAAFSGSAEVGRVDVSVRRLDDCVDPATVARPCLLKIDVQGTELDVLRGGRGVLTCVDEAIVECSFVELYAGQALADDVIGELRAQGFRLRGFATPTYAPDGSPLQADLVFAR